MICTTSSHRVVSLSFYVQRFGECNVMCDFGKIFRKFPVLFPKFYGRNNFVRKIFWIFQLSRQNFLDRPTFDRKFFGFFKFRTEKNSQNLRLGEILLRQVYGGK